MPLVVDLYQRYNPVTDWNALARAVSGAYVKYSDGTGGASTPADNYVSRCRGVSIPYGGYHFAEAGDAAQQARVFLAQYNRLGGVLAPALDLESGDIPSASRGAFARTFLEIVHQAYPLVVLYASASWLASLKPDTWPYDWDRTWVAAYGNNDGTRHAVSGYGGRIDMHQFTSNGRVAGASGNVDLDWTDDLDRFRLDRVVTTESASVSSLASLYTEDEMPRLPKGGSEGKGINYQLAVSMLREHDVIIAPGDSPVVLYGSYHWAWNTGTGGNPVQDPNHPVVVPVQGSYSYIVPKGTGKVDLLYWSDDDFSVSVQPRV